ncbi:MAG: hypothetical protein FWG47_05885 [Propionibacteriaceae bacterium]|nr:hypothetical protein [Propionibacteriaceae bacterium]
MGTNHPEPITSYLQPQMQAPTPISNESGRRMNSCRLEMYKIRALQPELSMAEINQHIEKWIAMGWQVFAVTPFGDASGYGKILVTYAKYEPELR